MDTVHLDRFGTEMKEKSIGLKLDTTIWGESARNDFSRATMAVKNVLWKQVQERDDFQRLTLLLP